MSSMLFVHERQIGQRDGQSPDLTLTAHSVRLISLTRTRQANMQLLTLFQL